MSDHLKSSSLPVEEQLVYQDERVIHLPAYQLFSIKLFKLPDEPINDREALSLLLRHVRYRDSYASSVFEDAVSIHGPYCLEAITTGAFERSDAASAEAIIRTWAEQVVPVPDLQRDQHETEHNEVQAVGYGRQPESPSPGDPAPPHEPTKTADDVHKALDPLPDGKNEPIKTLPTPEEIRKTFEDLTQNAPEAPHPRYDGERRRLDDGTVIGIRQSKQWGPTLDVVYPDGTDQKVHLPKPIKNANPPPTSSVPQAPPVISAPPTLPPELNHPPVTAVPPPVADHPPATVPPVVEHS
jgi:hypothetical protein